MNMTDFGIKNWKINTKERKVKKKKKGHRGANVG